MTKNEASNARNNNPPMPYLFVVGCPRSGTTLLQRILDAHPQLTVAYDTLFIPKGAPRLKPGKNPKLAPEIVERTRNFERFHRLGLPDEAVDRAVAASHTYADFVSALYGELAALKGKPLAGEKSPGYVKHIPLLHSLFPDAKFVHIIRDGRDVALSLLDWGEKNRGPSRQYDLWKEEPVAVCALWWKSYVEAGRGQSTKLGPELYCEICYEELVAEPEKESQNLCRFLGLPDSDSMVNYHQGKMRSKPGKSAKAAWLPPTQGLRDWRTSMSDRDQAVFECLAGDLLAELGYERRIRRPAPEIIEIAQKCETRWNARKPSPRFGSTGTTNGNTTGGVPGAGRKLLNGNVHRSLRTSESTEFRNNPYVFVVGCPRSGTTLLQRMLDHHPSLVLINEAHFIPKVIGKLPPNGDPKLTPDLVERVCEYRGFAKLDLSEATARDIAASSSTYSEFVAGLFAEVAKERGKPFVGEKTPGYVKRLEVLHRLFPTAKFVHLIRDGRDVALSALAWDNEKGPKRFALWEREPLACCTLWWAEMVSAGRKEGGKLGPSLYHEIVYEDLVSKPEESLTGLCDFLSLAYSPEMASYHLGRVRHEPGLSAKKSWLPPTPGLRNWRHDLKPRDTELFEALAGDLLEELGYERAIPKPSPGIEALAAACREEWLAEKTLRKEKREAESDSREHSLLSSTI